MSAVINAKIENACDRCDLETLGDQIPLFTPEVLQPCIKRCIQSGFIEGLHLLIEAGVPFNEMYQKYFIHANYVALVDHLFDQITITADLLKQIRSLEMLDLFISKGFDLNSTIVNGDDVWIWTNLIKFKEDPIGCTRYQLLQGLTERGANFKIFIEGYNNLVLVAIDHDDVSLLEFCDHHDIDLFGPLTGKNQGRGNLLHACVICKASKCAKYLLDRGIDRTVTDIDDKLAYEIETAVNSNEVKTLIRTYEEIPMIKEPEYR